MHTTDQRPKWFTEEHVTAWDRIKEAVRRDWEQTKHDLHLPGGHELNQNASDTFKQAAGKENIPLDDRPNPPKVIGSWDDVELPIGYGYGAHRNFGAEHPRWDDSVDAALRRDWDAMGKRGESWDKVQPWVRYGYEYRDNP